uniref:Uncharacterized protein n=1 Tax=Oryza brachyantha TaxID=4533 RepID=J3LVC9_ORYBR
MASGAPTCQFFLSPSLPSSPLSSSFLFFSRAASADRGSGGWPDGCVPAAIITASATLPYIPEVSVVRAEHLLHSGDAQPGAGLSLQGHIPLHHRDRLRGGRADRVREGAGSSMTAAARTRERERKVSYFIPSPYTDYGDGGQINRVGRNAKSATA